MLDIVVSCVMRISCRIGAHHQGPEAAAEAAHAATAEVSLAATAEVAA